MHSRPVGARPCGFRLLAVLSALLLAGPAQLLAQEYTLDDWLTVSTVGEYVWAPDGSSIYYTSNAAPTGTAAIFRIDASGGVPKLLSQTAPGERPEPVQELTVAPDGQTLFFTQARPCLDGDPDTGPCAVGVRGRPRRDTGGVLPSVARELRRKRHRASAADPGAARWVGPAS